MKEEKNKLFSKNWEKVVSATSYFRDNYNEEAEKLFLDFIRSDNKSWFLKSYAAEAIGENSTSLNTFEELLKIFISTNSKDFKPKCKDTLNVISSKINVSESQLYQDFLKKEKIESLAYYDNRKFYKWTKENWKEKLFEKAITIPSKLKNQWQSKRINIQIECTNNIVGLVDCLVNSEGISVSTGIKTKMIHVAANRVNEAPNFTGLYKGKIKFTELTSQNLEAVNNVNEFLNELTQLEINIRNVDFIEAVNFLPDITHKKNFEPHENRDPHRWNYMGVLNFSIKDGNIERSKKIAEYIMELHSDKWGYTEYLQHVKKHGH